MNKKRIILSALLFMAMSFSRPCMGENVLQPIGVQVVLSLIGSNDDILYPGLPKSPVLPPVIYLNSYSLFFSDIYIDAVSVELRDATGNVVYADYLPAGTQTLSLPATLSGTYTLFIYIGNYVFAGPINL